MNTSLIDFFEHPEPYAKSEFGTRPHMFNREDMVRVLGKVPTEGSEAYDTVLEFLESPDYEAKDLELFGVLGLNLVEGLPLGAGEAYIQYALLVRDNYAGEQIYTLAETGDFDIDGYPETELVHGEVVRYGKSLDVPVSRVADVYPMSGRGVSFEEGLVLNDPVESAGGVITSTAESSRKRVYVTHNIKSTGLTIGAGESYMMEERNRNRMVGVESRQSLHFALKVERLFREKGILTAKMLPPIELEEIFFRNKLIKKGEEGFVPVVQTHRAFASNVRINNLYTTYTASDFNRNDVATISKNPEFSRDLMYGRVVGFLDDVEAVRRFNRANGTNYVIGCSDKFDANEEVTAESYCRAFRRQLVQNTALMIANDIEHYNLSPQNVTIAGEFVDLNEVVFIRDGKSYGLGTEKEVSDSEIAALRVGVVLSMINSVHTAQGIVTSVLGNDEDYYSHEDLWADVRNLLPDDFWAKELSFAEIMGIRDNAYSTQEDPTKEVYELFKRLR